MKEIIIGTRASKLAMVQSRAVLEALAAANPNYSFKLKKITTKGDRILDKPLAEIEGKGIFIREIEVALLKREIDLAVHSFKDLPTELVPGLEIAAVPTRANALDVLIAKDDLQLEELATGARIGTGSLRRQAQLLNYRPDLEIVPLRGNIDTRLKKLQESELAAIVLAAAGLERMGWQDRISQYLTPEICLPAARQGALAVESRAADQQLKAILQAINHQETACCVKAEQALLAQLQGGCKVPLGAYAIIDTQEPEKIVLSGVVASVDGKRLLRDTISGSRERAEALGSRLARRLLEAGAAEILKNIK